MSRSSIPLAERRISDKNPGGRPRKEKREQDVKEVQWLLSQLASKNASGLTGRLELRTLAFLLHRHAAKRRAAHPGAPTLALPGPVVPAGKWSDEIEKAWAEAARYCRAERARRITRRLACARAGEPVSGIRLAQVDPEAKVVDATGDLVPAPLSAQPHALSLDREPLPGLYYEDLPRPVGGRGEASLELARRVHERPGRPQLVEMSEADLTAHRDRALVETDEVAIAERVAARFPAKSAERKLSHLFQRARQVQFQHLGHPDAAPAALVLALRRAAPGRYSRLPYESALYERGWPPARIALAAGLDEAAVRRDLIVDTYLRSP